MFNYSQENSRKTGYMQTPLRIFLALIKVPFCLITSLSVFILGVGLRGAAKKGLSKVKQSAN